MIVRFVESHMNLCLILGCVLGLLWPYWGAVPDESVIALIMGATLIACFRLNMQELRQVPWRLSAWFYLLRYILLPPAIYFLSGLFFSNDIALGLMLMALLPVGASAPAISHVFGGQVALTAIFTLSTTLLAPLFMPLMFAGLGSESAAPPSHMFITLIIALVLPCVVFLYVRIFPLCHRLAADYGKTATILMISIMISIVVGKQRGRILAEPEMIALLMILCTALLAFLLWVGWVFSARLNRSQRISFATASGFNNIGLGVGMALLHFNAAVVLVALATELAWAFLPVVMRWLSSGK